MSSRASSGFCRCSLTVCSSSARFSRRPRISRRAHFGSLLMSFSGIVLLLTPNISECQVHGRPVPAYSMIRLRSVVLIVDRPVGTGLGEEYPDLAVPAHLVVRVGEANDLNAVVAHPSLSFFQPGR